MACYDCDLCSYNIDYGGNCDLAMYDCPFAIVSAYNSEDLDEMRETINLMFDNIKHLREIDTEYAIDELDTIKGMIDSLYSKVSEETEQKWKVVSKNKKQI